MDYSVLGVVALVLFFERERQLFLLFMVISVVLGGSVGVVAGLIFWFLFRFLSIFRRVFTDQA